MTVDNEIKTLAKVCRLLAKQMASHDDMEWGFTQQKTDNALDLLDTIDAKDDEPEKPPKCTHENYACYHGRITEYEMFRCSNCKRLGRKLYLGPATHGEIEWWPEGGAK